MRLSAAKGSRRRASGLRLLPVAAGWRLGSARRSAVRQPALVQRDEQPGGDQGGREEKVRETVARAGELGGIRTKDEGAV